MMSHRGRGEINGVSPALPIPRSLYISCTFCCNERRKTSYATTVIHVFGIYFVE